MYMATLCEMIVFSLSSKSWNSVGLRTLLAPLESVRRFRNGMVVEVEGEDTYCCSRL